MEPWGVGILWRLSSVSVDLPSSQALLGALPCHPVQLLPRLCRQGYSRAFVTCRRLTYASIPSRDTTSAATLIACMGFRQLALGNARLVRLAGLHGASRSSCSFTSSKVRVSDGTMPPQPSLRTEYHTMTENDGGRPRPRPSLHSAASFSREPPTPGCQHPGCRGPSFQLSFTNLSSERAHSTR